MADAATFDGTADATINVKTLDATKLKGTAPVSTTGNAATASKLATPRTLSLTGKAAGSTTFDGSANATINVTSVNADTASKLSTARKINITGNATGAAAFDGSADANISVTVNESKHATAADTLKSSPATETSTVARPVWLSWEGDNTKQTVSPNLTYTCSTKTLTAANFAGHLAGNADTATADKYGTDIADNYVRKYVNVGEQDLNNFRYGGLYCNPTNSAATSARHYPKNEAGSLLVLNNGANGVDGCTQIYTTYAAHDSYKREYDVASKTWSDWRKYAFEDSTVARALIANNLNSGADTGSITINQSGYSDYSPTVGGNYANMNISSWFGVSFTSQCGGTVPKGKTAVGIDCREGIVRARSFEGALNGTATNADTVDGVHAGSMFYNKGNWAADNWATMGAYQVNSVSITGGAYGWGQVISSSTNDARFQLYATHQYGGDGRLHYRTGWDSNKQDWNTILDSENYNLFAPTKTGSGASGTWGINISGTATNADKLDGYHASDLLRHLGGNRTPVITDIFDRAGTIDMTTMSAADKATHKANINKARNATQNIWNTDTGIYAYGGDYDMSNGYGRGSLKLTQSYKNFDKILVVGANDKGELLIYKLWDVWALANAFAGGSRFQLFHGSDYWFLYGSARKGTRAGYALSTDTVWSCQDQNSGIVAIYGIKY